MDTKKTYTRPQIRKVTIDNGIRSLMMSFGPGDPEGIMRQLSPLR